MKKHRPLIHHRSGVHCDIDPTLVSRKKNLFKIIRVCAFPPPPPSLSPIGLVSNESYTHGTLDQMRKSVQQKDHSRIDFHRIASVHCSVDLLI